MANRTVLPIPWTPEWELSEYWDHVMEDPKEMARDKAAFRRDLDFFDLPEKIPGTVVDVGAGPFGGVFGFHRFGARKIIVDPLATEYERRYGRMPGGVELIDGYSDAIPLEDEIADVVFCIEALDHCNSEYQFRRSAFELARILKVEGTLYFMIPNRARIQDGHLMALEVLDADHMVTAFPLSVKHQTIAATGIYAEFEKI